MDAATISNAIEKYIKSSFDLEDEFIFDLKTIKRFIDGTLTRAEMDYYLMNGIDSYTDLMDWVGVSTQDIQIILEYTQKNS